MGEIGEYWRDAKVHLERMRAERLERFVKEVLPELESKYTVMIDCNKDAYTFIHEKHGVCTIYPKANKFHVHKQNKWIQPGIKYLCRNILRNA